MFLSADDLITLTGRRTASAQIRVLTKQGIPYHINANNKPVVLADNLKKPEQPTLTPERPKLNLPKVKCGNGKPTNTSHAASI